MAVNNVAVWHVCNIYTQTLLYVNIKQCFITTIIIMNPKFILFSLLHSPCLPTLFTSLLSFSFQESKPTVCRVPTSSFGNLSFLCSALGSPLHFFLIRASFSPPLCSALVSGGLRVDLVRQMVWEWQRDRKARRRGGGEEREQTAVPGVSWSRSSKKYLTQCHPFPCATRDRNKKLTWNWAQIGGVLRWLLVLPRHYSGLQ